MKVESAPNVITRNGLNVGYKIFRVLFQYSYVGESFSDPLNTITQQQMGAKGIVPGYGLFDLNTTLRFSNSIILRAGINNLTNKQYFTKRPLFYPGPGVWSSDGRSFVVSLGIKI
jgi:Fe(3+) dicitrate transport protein